MVSTRTLQKIAIAGGFIVVSASFYFERKIVDGIKEKEHYRLALQTLRDHHGASSLLGEPIKDLRFRLSNKENVCNFDNVRLLVPVEGSKQFGVYYYWANKIEDHWKVTKAELELGDDKMKRLVIVKDNLPDEESFIQQESI